MQSGEGLKEVLMDLATLCLYNNFYMMTTELLFSPGVWETFPALISDPVSQTAIIVNNQVIVHSGEPRSAS